MILLFATACKVMIIDDIIIIILLTFVKIISRGSFQMCPQMKILNRCIVALYTFVIWYFDGLVFCHHSREWVIMIIQKMMMVIMVYDDDILMILLLTAAGGWERWGVLDEEGGLCWEGNYWGTFCVKQRTDISTLRIVRKSRKTINWHNSDRYPGK